jgi:hypothetical protein
MPLSKYPKEHYHYHFTTPEKGCWVKANFVKPKRQNNATTRRLTLCRIALLFPFSKKLIAIIGGYN